MRSHRHIGLSERGALDTFLSELDLQVHEDLALSAPSEASNCGVVAWFSLGGIYFRQAFTLVHEFDCICKPSDKPRVTPLGGEHSSRRSRKHHAAYKLEVFLERCVRYKSKSSLLISPTEIFLGHTSEGKSSPHSERAGWILGQVLQFQSLCIHPAELRRAHSQLLQSPFLTNRSESQFARQSLHRSFDYLYAATARWPHASKRHLSQSDIAQYAVLDLATFMFHSGHFKACGIAVHEALRVAQQRHDRSCVTAAALWLRYLAWHFESVKVMTTQTQQAKMHIGHSRNHLRKKLECKARLHISEGTSQIRRSQSSYRNQHAGLAALNFRRSYNLRTLHCLHRFAVLEAVERYCPTSRTMPQLRRPPDDQGKFTAPSNWTTKCVSTRP
mmetsp:Transcript_22125/g.71265  ORF Transcript_22125/g.71265 Transcript_22125/m.71265 type:complete len:387 (+) Transcript_22125:183-1343(+)